MARKAGDSTISEAERRLIRIAIDANEPISTIAKGLGRTRQAIWRQVKVMQARGDFAQAMLPLSGEMGQGDGEK